jgi:hypothetical protein
MFGGPLTIGSQAYVRNTGERAQPDQGPNECRRSRPRSIQGEITGSGRTCVSLKTSSRTIWWVQVVPHLENVAITMSPHRGA